MARTKNYTKQLDMIQKKITALEEKRKKLIDEAQALDEEYSELLKEQNALKLGQLQQIMDLKGLSVDDLSALVESN